MFHKFLSKSRKPRVIYWGQWSE